MKFPRIISLFLAALLLAGCGTAPAEPTSAAATLPPETTLPAETEAPISELDALLEGMTLRQKVGQLFIVRPEALDPAGSTVLTDAMIAALEEYPVGGIVMFARNIESPEQITAFNQELRDFSGIPPFLSVDEEGGAVARLANNAAFDLPRYKNAASIADAAQALEMGSAIGGYLKGYGFNMDFAPVADVNTNPDNPVIGTRAFSAEASAAAELAGAMAGGLNSQGIIAVFKHFPGHGDTAEDSHAGIAVSYKTADEMRQCEWLPFLEADSGDCVMVGHIAVPEITGSLIPATMSREIVMDILKEELGFEGLVITDALEMGAVTESYTPGEGALAALKAGCDILLMPADLREAFDAVVSAVEEGTYSETKLDETVRRILAFKAAHGILWLE
ncbi:MAG: glycoside hydrolase family 3 protein [Oscillospiraceae bacterium]|nr:glycoside hydrolase family 3 protein [Oscillospiraceae bacterium]